MSIDFKEKFQDEDNLNRKQDFLDYIVRIEELLEQAEEYGASGDARMLDIVESLQNIDKKVTDQADFANEQRPPIYHAAKITKILFSYFAKVIENEISRIQIGIGSEGLDERWNLEIKNLENKIYYFKQMYPTLDVDSFLKKISELGR